MPRAACRIRLEIQSVRVERLQDITEDDAIAEGCTTDFNHSADCSNDDCALCGDPEDCDGVVVTARENYMALWETLNGPNSWSANPYVWVITFKPVTPFA